MLEIRTVTAYTPGHFDDTVNEAIKEGWELVRRECFITGADRATTFYAELERIVEDAEDEEEVYSTDTTAHWNIIREPRNPYQCSACGHRTNALWPTCPECKRTMLEDVD